MYPNVKRWVWRLDIQELLKSLSDEFHYNLEIISLSHIRDILIDNFLFKTNANEQIVCIL